MERELTKGTMGKKNPANERESPIQNKIIGPLQRQIENSRANEPPTFQWNKDNNQCQQFR